MSRYRLAPTLAQAVVLRDHCAHARFVWNLAVEQHGHWRPGRKGAPGYLEQCRQLTAARAEHRWLAQGSQMMQQQALRDFAQAMSEHFPRDTWPSVVAQGRPGTRDSGSSRSSPVTCGAFPVTCGEVRVPRVGWVRFRWSRAVPPSVKSYRVTLNRAGRWHVAFAAIPSTVTAPGNGGDQSASSAA